VTVYKCPNVEMYKCTNHEASRSAVLSGLPSLALRQTRTSLSGSYPRTPPAFVLPIMQERKISYLHERRFVMFGVLLPCTSLTAGDVKRSNVENSDVGNGTQNVSDFLLV